MSVLRDGFAHLNQFEVLDALKERSVPREQSQIVGQSDTGDQAVAHSDCLTFPVKLPPNFCSPPCRGAVQRQHIEPIDQLANGLTSLVFTGAIEKLETGNSRGLESLCVEVNFQAIPHLATLQPCVTAMPDG